MLWRGIVDEFGESRRNTLAFAPSNSSDVAHCHLFSPLFWDALRYNFADVNEDNVTSIKRLLH